MPFHINTIKNVSKNDEGDFTYIRINFQTPGQLTGKKDETPFEDSEATFVRSVSYRSPDSHRFDNISKQITELKKEANKREQQKKEMADVVEQGNLVEVKGRRPIKLSEAFVRPALDGKRLPGEVEIHQNGVRYQSVGAQKIGGCTTVWMQRTEKRLTVVNRCFVQQYQTSIFPAMRPRVVGHRSPSSQVPYHDWKEEDFCRSLL